MPRIRPAHVDDLPAISAVCLAAFNVAVAPSLSAAGIATFGSVAAAKAFGARLPGDNHILVAKQEDRIIGVVELEEGGPGAGSGLKASAGHGPALPGNAGRASCPAARPS